MTDKAMEAAARAAFPEIYNLPRINLHRAAYERANASAQAAITAWTASLSAGAPELVTRLRQYGGKQWETTVCYNGLRDEAAATILALTAEMGRLRAALSPFGAANPHTPPEGVNRAQWAGDVNRAYTLLIDAHLTGSAG